MALQFRPLKTGNGAVDEALRQAFDAIYALQAQTGVVSGGSTAVTSAADARGGGSGLGRAVVLYVNGTLRIQNDAAPRVVLPQTFRPSLLRMDVKQAPVEAAIQVTLSYVSANGTQAQVATFSLPAGSTSCTASASKAIPAGAYLRLDITAVGTKAPGSDLTVLLA